MSLRLIQPSPDMTADELAVVGWNALKVSETAQRIVNTVQQIEAARQRENGPPVDANEAVDPEPPAGEDSGETVVAPTPSADASA